jgi:ribosomal protein L29
MYEIYRSESENMQHIVVANRPAATSENYSSSGAAAHADEAERRQRDQLDPAEKKRINDLENICNELKNELLELRQLSSQQETLRNSPENNRVVRMRSTSEAAVQSTPDETTYFTAKKGKRFLQDEVSQYHFSRNSWEL